MALGNFSNRNFTNLAEVRVHLYKQKNTSCVNILEVSPTLDLFYNHILRTFHQLTQYATSGEALIDVRYPQKNEWEKTMANIF